MGLHKELRELRERLHEDLIEVPAVGLVHIDTNLLGAWTNVCDVAMAYVERVYLTVHVLILRRRAL